MIRLVLTTEEGQVWSLELQPGRNRVGRKPDNDIVLENPGISSYHCEITLQEDQVLVHDLRSTNGTFIEGERLVQEPVPVAPGQTLQLGQLKTVLQDSSIKVAVPESALPRAEQPVLLPGGIPACLNHPEEPAVWLCSHCSEHYCNPCVHHMRRVGGKYMNLCPHCSNACHLLESAASMAKRKGFLKRLGKWLGRTVRLRS
jgi:hypothetical protein